MNWPIMLAQLLLSISILVAVHEMGHLLAAKYFGMRVEKFSIGFPPKIFSFKKGDTEYALSAIPLGGFVKISGMIDESLDTKDLNEPPKPYEFRAKPAWQRLIVMLGGIIVNVVVGILIFIGLTYGYGDTYLSKDVINQNGGFVPGSVGEKLGFRTGDKIVAINGQDFEYFEDLTDLDVLLGDNVYFTVEREGQLVDIDIPPNLIEQINSANGKLEFLLPRSAPVVSVITEGSLAERLGLQLGDRFVAINGKPIQFRDEAMAGIAASKSDTLRFTIARGSEQLTFSEFLSDSILGVGISGMPDFVEQAERKVSYGFFESIPLGTERAFTTLAVQVKAFGKIFSGELSARKNLSGPIGIMRAFGPEWDWQRFWSLTGVLSLVLAFMNFLPIPALDGGHVMFLTYEIVSRRKPSDRFLENAQKTGMVFLLLLMVFIFTNDIIKFFE